MEKKSCIGLDSYEIEAWIGTLKSMPVKVIEQGDQSASYEMEKMHVLLLENGEFATVHESGCSCYS